MGRAVLAVHVWMVATLIPLLDRLLSLRAILRVLTPPAGLALYRGVGAHCIAAVVRARLRRPRHMRRRACLREGLTMFHFLRLADLPAELHIGVYPAGGRARRGHCWVTCGSETMNAEPAQPVAVLLRHGTPS